MVQFVCSPLPAKTQWGAKLGVQARAWWGLRDETGRSLSAVTLSPPAVSTQSALSQFTSLPAPRSLSPSFLQDAHKTCPRSASSRPARTTFWSEILETLKGAGEK